MEHPTNLPAHYRVLLTRVTSRGSRLNGIPPAVCDSPAVVATPAHTL
jgi:hypothetical protein